MRSLRTTIAVLCALTVTTSVWAQQAKPGDILEQIPADSMGFVAVKDVEGFAGKVESFAGEIGAGEMLKQQMPAGLVAKMKGKMQLGDGFNPKGGMAMVMLNPKEYGIDLTDYMPDPQTGMPAKEPNPNEMPILIYVPAKDIQSTFAAYNPQPDGKLMKMTGPTGDVYAAEGNGYVILSPLKAALAKASGGKSVAKAAPKDHLKLVGRNDAFMHVNMEVAGPVLLKMIDAMEKQMLQPPAGGMGPGGGMPMPMAGPMMAMAPMMKPMLDMYRTLIGEATAVTAGMRFAKDGLVGEKIASFKSKGKVAGILNSGKAIDGQPLGKVPSLPYIAAAQMTIPKSDAVQDFRQQMFTAMFQSPMFAQVPANLKKQANELDAKMLAQIQEIQFVVGGAPKNSGVFGMAYVMKVKSAENTKKLLAEGAGLGEQMVKEVFKAMGAPTDTPDSPTNLTIKYQQGVENVDGLATDVISIDHPNLSQMPEEQKKMMSTVLGDDKVRFFVNSPDKNTVVMSFGGSTRFLGEVVKAVKTGGPLPNDKNVAQAMAHMPSKPCCVMLVSPGNALQVVKTGMAAMGENAPLPIQIDTKVPIALGVTTGGDDLHAVGYVPTSLVKEGFAAWQAAMMGGMEEGAETYPPGGEEF